MANEEHLKIIKQGVKTWNQWRDKNPRIIPDLSRAKLTRKNLTNVDLRYTNLSNAYLDKAVLKSASLSYANLTYASLSEADIDDVHFIEANLTGAYLVYANLRDVVLDKAILINAIIGSTMFGNIDFSTVKGLDTISHVFPSTIGVDTIYRSKGNIPEVFLRGAGMPDNFIDYMNSLTGKAFELYSCFISYSSKDHDFAERLHADLQDRGVRCWFAPEDIKIGDRIRITIDQSIKKYDKLLLVLSQESLLSDWVEQEVETALAKEREEKRLVLFPIRLDETVMRIQDGWPAYIKNTRHIGDFTKWKDYDSYQKGIGRLIRDLKAEDLPSPT